MVEQTFSNKGAMKSSDYHNEELSVLETNLDDMNPELFPWVLKLLFEGGALDCWATPIIMKHGRPGFSLSALCQDSMVEPLSRIIFQETTALGIRVSKRNRLSLAREIIKVETPYGEVGIKIAKDLAGRIINALPEFRDCESRATESGASLKEVYQAAQFAERARREKEPK